LTVVFHPLAERELIESAKFYDKRAAGLGADFIRQVEHTLATVVADPGAGNVLSGAIRRRLVQRFPFAVLYKHGPCAGTRDAIEEIAQRRTGYWKRRLKPMP